MPKFCFGLLCGFLICALLVLPGMTQQAEQIVIGGVPLQIGMAKDTVLSKIAERGFSLTSGNNLSSSAASPTLFVREKNDRGDYDVVGAVTFKDSRLFWASRTWGDEDAGAAKLVRNLYFLLNSFEKQGNTSCTIETREQESPDLNSKSVDIHCGKRTASLYTVAYKEQRPVANLDETIK
jgi:hypothetical protein